MCCLVNYVLVVVVLCSARVCCVQKQNLEDDGGSGETRATGKRIGDACVNTDDCRVNIAGSVCDPVSQVCNCSSEFPVQGRQACSKALELNDSCSFSAQCRFKDKHRECRNKKCQCETKFHPNYVDSDGNTWCIEDEPDEWEVGSYVDPTMIGVLVGLGLMFIIMCVVLRLFSKARWRENRSIFNTPNPRLMNASLLKEGNKSSGSRRGSLRSRQPSLASLPLSPDGSTAGNGLRRSSSQTSLQEDAATSTEASHVALEVSQLVTKV